MHYMRRAVKKTEPAFVTTVLLSPTMKTIKKLINDHPNQKVFQQIIECHVY